MAGCCAAPSRRCRPWGLPTARAPTRGRTSGRGREGALYNSSAAGHGWVNRMPESGVVPLMNAETEVAILFADVVGSTRLYELLGDHLARDMIVTCVELMRGSTERNRGTVIKTIGDEILAIFPTASDA